MTVTPRDIENPKRPSGYDHVTRRGDDARSPFVANVYGGDKDSSGRTWQGPRRASAIVAAQDYCDYVNGNPTALSAALKRVGKTRTPRDPMADEEVQAALGVLRDARAQRRGRQGFVYLIGVSDCSAVKVGYSVKPEARVSELQTGNHLELALLASKVGTEADERALHEKYIHDNLLLEWFKPSAALYQEFGLDLPSDT